MTIEEQFEKALTVAIRDRIQRKAQSIAAGLIESGVFSNAIDDQMTSTLIGGHPYIVGDSGPELFMPLRSGVLKF